MGKNNKTFVKCTLFIATRKGGKLESRCEDIWKHPEKSSREQDAEEARAVACTACADSGAHDGPRRPRGHGRHPERVWLPSLKDVVVVPEHIVA